MPSPPKKARACQQCDVHWKKFASVDAPTTMFGGSAVEVVPHDSSDVVKLRAEPSNWTNQRTLSQWSKPRG